MGENTIECDAIQLFRYPYLYIYANDCHVTGKGRRDWPTAFGVHMKGRRIFWVSAGFGCLDLALAILAAWDDAWHTPSSFRAGDRETLNGCSSAGATEYFCPLCEGNFRIKAGCFFSVEGLLSNYRTSVVVVGAFASRDRYQW